MGIVVNTNVSSILVQRSLNTATNAVSRSLEKLSTGYRINRAADDAARHVQKAHGRGQSHRLARVPLSAHAGLRLRDAGRGL